MLQAALALHIQTGKKFKKPWLAYAWPKVLWVTVFSFVESLVAEAPPFRASRPFGSQWSFGRVTKRHLGDGHSPHSVYSSFHTNYAKIQVRGSYGKYGVA